MADKRKTVKVRTKGDAATEKAQAQAKQSIAASLAALRVRAA